MAHEERCPTECQRVTTIRIVLLMQLLDSLWQGSRSKSRYSVRDVAGECDILERVLLQESPGEFR